MAQTFPLHERIKGTIAALRAHYSKSAAQAALADLEAVLPLIEAPNGAHLSGFLQGLDAGIEVSQARAQPLPPDLVTRAAAVAHALEQGNADEEAEIYGDKTAVKVLRDIIAVVEASADTTLETRFTEVHYAVDGAGGPRTVFRFEGLPDVSVPDPDADKLVARHIGQSGLKNKVAAAICNNSNYPPAAQVHILGRNLTRLIDAVFGALGVVPVTVGDDPGVGRGDETVVTVVDQETGERVEWREGDRCTINGEGSTVFTLRELRANVAMPVDPSGQPNGWKSYEQMHKVTADPLAERARGAAGALRKLGLGEPASSVVADAADVLSEAGEALRGEAINLYWLVDEYNDTEGETFGIAVRASRDVDRALFKWARSYEAMLATERGETPQAAVLNRRLANGGDALTFRRGLTSAELEAIENASDNGYSARVRILSAEGTKVLLDAINDTPPGGSLSLYKGTLSTCMPELEDAEQPVPEPTELADLWVYEEKGAWEETDEPPQLGEHDADLAATAVPDQPGTLEAVYHQQGWSLVLAQDGRSTHLFRRDDKVGVMFVGPVACGANVVLGEIVKPLSERFDYPPHPELCARCCVVANDRR